YREWEAFRDRVEAVRRWRLLMRAHESTAAARAQTQARLDAAVEAGNISEQQRDAALSVIPQVAAPPRPDLEPPLTDEEEAAVMSIDLEELAPDAT
ncbi:MAG: hypothetical protein ACOC0J_03030, partial [Myxococcota bacterium]